MKHFIDIHTHDFSKPVMNCTSVYNVIAGVSEVPAGRSFSMGAHPWHQWNDGVKSLLETTVLENSNCIAVGECGLDGVHQHPTYTAGAFEWQVDLAKRSRKPIIIHAVRSVHAIVRILKEHDYAEKAIFHGANWKMETMQFVLDAGCSVSLGAALLKSHSEAHKFLKSSEVNVGQLFFETDDAQISIDSIYKTAKKLLDLRLSELCDQQAVNFSKMFKQKYYV